MGWLEEGKGWKTESTITKKNNKNDSKKVQLNLQTKRYVHDQIGFFKNINVSASHLNVSLKQQKKYSYFILLLLL